MPKLRKQKIFKKKSETRSESADPVPKDLESLTACNPFLTAPARSTNMINLDTQEVFNDLESLTTRNPFLTAPASSLSSSQDDNNQQFLEASKAFEALMKTRKGQQYPKSPKQIKTESAKPRKKRSRSCSYTRRNSDSEDACNYMFNLSLDEILKQDRRLKEHITYLVQKLNRDQCILFCVLLLNRYPSLERVSQEQLEKTSPRFQHVVRSNKKYYQKNIQTSTTNLIPAVLSYTLSRDQKKRDTVRLKAHIMTLVANLPHSENLDIVKTILKEFPKLKDENSKYFMLASPKRSNIFN